MKHPSAILPTTAALICFYCTVQDANYCRNMGANKRGRDQHEKISRELVVDTRSPSPRVSGLTRKFKIAPKETRGTDRPTSGCIPHHHT